MLRIELRIEEGATVLNTPEEVTTISETLKVELESLKERNKTAIGRCAMKQYENTRLRYIHTSQRQEIKAFKKRIEEIESADRMLKADNANLKRKLFVKYYPTDGQIKAEKERDELQMKLDILEARKAEAIEHLRL